MRDGLRAVFHLFREILSMRQALAWRHAIIACLVLLLCCPALSQAAGRLQQITERGVLVCGVLDSVTPFGFLDESSNSLRGFEVDLCRAVASRLGVGLQLKPMAPADRIPLLLQGGVDLVAATLTHSYERDEIVDFSITYFMDGQKIMAPLASGALDVAGLEGKRVAAVAGARAAETIAQLQPAATVLEYPTAPQAFLALTRGDVDAMTADSVTLLGLKHVAEVPDDWVLGDALLTREPYAMAMAENDSDFRDAVNRALAEIWLEGEYEDIYDTWFGPQSPYRVPLDWQMTVWP